MPPTHRLLLSAVACLLLSAAPALAQGEPAPEDSRSRQEEFLRLAGTYQSAYLQLVAVSALEVYSTAGIIATDFDKGHIDAATALTALEHSSLLHSVCSSTLLEIGGLTPEEDVDAHYEIGRLLNLLSTEDLLLTTLGDWFGEPTEEGAQAVSEARELFERTMDEYLAGTLSTEGS